MSLNQTGKKEEASKAFSSGLEYAKDKLPQEAYLVNYSGWNDWIFAHSLIREAETLLEFNPENQQLSK